MKWEILQLLSLPKETHCAPPPSAHGDQAFFEKKNKENRKKGQTKPPRCKRCVIASSVWQRTATLSLVLRWGFCLMSLLHKLLFLKNTCCTGACGKEHVSCTWSFGVTWNGDIIPCIVLFPISKCMLKVHALNSQIWMESRGKNLMFLVNKHDVQFLVSWALSKSSLIDCQKTCPENAGTGVDIAQLSQPDQASQAVYSSAATPAWTACYTKFMQMSCADISTLTRAWFHPCLGAALLWLQLL